MGEESRAMFQSDGWSLRVVMWFLAHMGGGGEVLSIGVETTVGLKESREVVELN